jgi:phosphoglycolate phosphatase
MITRMRILLFDIDGTLLLTNRGGSGALKLAMEQEFGIAVARTDINFSGRTDRSLLFEILQRNGLPSSDEFQTRLANVYIQLLPEVLRQHGGQVMPGAIELLEQLSNRPDLGCYVMTGNMHQTANLKLAHFGMLHYFRGVFGGDHDHERNDLAKRTATLLRDRYGASALQDVVVIGDTPADIQCGHAIGAKVVAVCTGAHSREELQRDRPLAVVDDMSDLATMLELLEIPGSSTPTA